MSDISPSTGETFYSGSWQDIQDVLRVLNIGEGKMAQVTQPMVNRYQEMVDRDIDAILQDTYHTPIRSFNMVQPTISGTPAVPGGSESGVIAITSGVNSITVAGAGWSFVPTTVVVTVTKPSGGDQIFATVDESTITANGFTAYLSAPVPASGYSLSYIVTAEAISGASAPSTGLQVRVFPGDVRRAARYWTAGQILVNEFQQLEGNLTEQATQMVADARMQVYAFSRPNHRIPGQRRLSNISHFLPASLQPSAFPERPS
jgi:hypothetical protein